jgi:hypothetical protein
VRDLSMYDERLANLHDDGGPLQFFADVYGTGIRGLYAANVSHEVKALRKQGLVLVNDGNCRYWVLEFAPKSIAIAWAVRFTNREITETEHTRDFFERAPQESDALRVYGATFGLTVGLAIGANAQLRSTKAELTKV